jgi:hypothetical protein
MAKLEQLWQSLPKPDPIADITRMHQKMQQLAASYSGNPPAFGKTWAMDVDIDDQHWVCERGAGFLLDAMARGFNAAEAQMFQRAALSQDAEILRVYGHSPGYICYGPSTKRKPTIIDPTKYSGGRKFDRDARGARTEVYLSHRKDAHWVYDQRTGQWNPEWQLRHKHRTTAPNTSP